MTDTVELIGRGAYSLREASRLTRVPMRAIRRWTQGYDWDNRGRQGHSDPIVATLHSPVDGSPILDFADLIEIRFLHAFRDYGVSWHAIRIAAKTAADLIGKRHPFSSRIFMTDGHTILADVVNQNRGRRDAKLIDLVRDQYEFRSVVRPHLHATLEFSAKDEPERWWPLGRRRRVVLDPERAFGAPIVDTYGIPTLILAPAVIAEGSAARAAEHYRVSEQAVRNSVVFENSLRAA
jgi:uncharacterized protein (DUF433 family)